MKSTPKLPAAAIMQPPAAANKPMSKPSKVSIKKGGVAAKVVSKAKGKHGMAMKSKSC